jgi:hypothetical protein
MEEKEKSGNSQVTVLRPIDKSASGMESQHMLSSPIKRISDTYLASQHHCVDSKLEEDKGLFSQSNLNESEKKRIQYQPFYPKGSFGLNKPAVTQGKYYVNSHGDSSEKSSGFSVSSRRSASPGESTYPGLRPISNPNEYDFQKGGPGFYSPQPNFNYNYVGEQLIPQFQNFQINQPTIITPIVYAQPYYASYCFPNVNNPMMPVQIGSYIQPQYTNNYAQANPNIVQYQQQPVLKNDSKPQPKALTNEEYVCSIIEPFENSKGDLKLIAGEIVKLAHFQSGSRYLQKKIAEGNREFLGLVITEVNFSLNPKSN